MSRGLRLLQWGDRVKGAAAFIVLALLITGCEMPSGQQAQQPMGPADFIINTVFFFLSMLFVYWVLVLRPSQVAEQEREEFVDKLRKGDEVVTTGGILGRIAVVKKDVVTLEIAPNVKIRVMPDHVRPLPKEGTESAGQGSKQNEPKAKK